MAADFFLSFKGFDEFKALMLDLPNKLKRKYLRPSLLAGAKVVRDAVIPATPRLAKPVYRDGKLIRTPGLLKSRIKVRTSREATKNGDVDLGVARLFVRRYWRAAP